MPKWIITHFIVAVYYLIEKQQLVWRNGVISEKDRTRAEVIESDDRSKIFINVSRKSRKQFMTIVRHELEKFTTNLIGID